MTTANRNKAMDHANRNKYTMLIPGMKSRPESEEQIAFFNHIDIRMEQVPWLVLAYANPNGGMRPQKTTFRNGKAIAYSTEGKKLKQQGARDGIPDITIPAPRGIYHGFYLELKRRPYLDRNGKLIKEYPDKKQRARLKWLKAVGYFAEPAWGSDQSISLLEWYITLPPGPNTHFELFDPEFVKITIDKRSKLE